MHAHLIISQNTNVESQVSDLAKKLHAKVIEFPLAKIEDVRNLGNLIRLSFDEPALIFSPNIHEATEEALNAFLKNLEEPQENVYFALSTTSAKKVLPTIVSRCQIIRVAGELNNEKGAPEIEEFLSMTTGKKLNYIDKIKDRKIALELAGNTVNFIHSQLHKNKVKYDIAAANCELGLKTYSRLKANGAVNLHLVNFVINYING